MAFTKGRGLSPASLEDIQGETEWKSYGLDAHTVHLTGWDVPLQLALPVPEGCTAVGIRAHDFVPCDAGAPNALPVAALSSSENPFDWNLICTAPDGTARLWWKVSKETMAAPPPKAPACLAAAPENIMPLV